jgi:hypothetical protein
MAAGASEAMTLRYSGRFAMVARTACPLTGAMLSDPVIWQLVTYLQSQPVPKDVPTLAWP